MTQSSHDLGDFFSLLKTAKTEDPLHRAIKSARKSIHEALEDPIVFNLEEKQLKDEPIVLSDDIKPEKTLGEFFSLVKTAKSEDPLHQLVSNIKQSVRSEAKTLFSKPIINSHQSSNYINVSVSENHSDDLEDEFVQEYNETNIESETKGINIQEAFSSEEVLTYLEKIKSELLSDIKDQHVSTQTLPKTSEYDLNIIQEKIKRMEVYIQNLSLHSTGSGEVKLINLDDVDRFLLSDEPNQIILYNPQEALKKASFRRTSQLDLKFGGVNSIRFNENAYELLQYEEELYAEDLVPESNDDDWSIKQQLSVDAVPGSILWNKFDDCLDVYHKDGTVLQSGLELYIQVKNNSDTETLLDGTFVRFGGVNGGLIPFAEPFVADGSIAPLYSIGIITNPIEPGKIGRATTIGKVRNINTTGIDVGESWVIGDVLWGHPTLPGKLTRIQPTAPNVAIAVGVVLSVSETHGIILVRPTIFPKLYYAGFYDTSNQFALESNTPTSVKLNQTSISSGIHIDTNDTSKVIVTQQGLYNFMFSMQISSTSSSRSNIWIWYRKNGLDVPYSTSNLTIESNGAKLVPGWNFVVSMNAGDYFQLFWATDNHTKVSLDAPEQTSFCPSIPSVILNVSQINL
jgi:hypothetical protein